MEIGKTGESSNSRTYVKATLVSLLLICCVLFTYLFVGRFGFSWPLFVVVSSLLASPLLLLFSYLLFRMLTPIAGQMPRGGFRQWILIYAFCIGFFLFYAFLSFVFDYFTPTLPAEDRHFTIPISIIASIAMISSFTRLRQPIRRLLSKIFDVKLPEQTEDRQT